MCSETITEIWRGKDTDLFCRVAIRLFLAKQRVRGEDKQGVWNAHWGSLSSQPPENPAIMADIRSFFMGCVNVPLFSPRVVLLRGAKPRRWHTAYCKPRITSIRAWSALLHEPGLHGIFANRASK